MTGSVVEPSVQSWVSDQGIYYSIDSRGSNWYPRESSFSASSPDLGILLDRRRVSIVRVQCWLRDMLMGDKQLGINWPEVLDSYRPLPKSEKHRRPTPNVVNSKSMATIAFKYMSIALTREEDKAYSLNTVNVARVVMYSLSELGW